MTIIQILLVVFFIFAITRVVSRYKSGDVLSTSFFGWILFWLAGAVIVILPNATSYFAKLIGVGRGADAVVYLSVALLFFIVFRILVNQRKIERIVTTLTRKLALDEEKKGRASSDVARHDFEQII